MTENENCQKMSCVTYTCCGGGAAPLELSANGAVFAEPQFPIHFTQMHRLYTGIEKQNQRENGKGRPQRPNATICAVGVLFPGFPGFRFSVGQCVCGQKLWIQSSRLVVCLQCLIDWCRCVRGVSFSCSLHSLLRDVSGNKAAKDQDARNEAPCY